MINQIKKVAGISLAASMVLAATAKNTQAFDFTFSFDNISGTTPGTVSGIITGLEDNTSNQPADSVIIDNFPAALQGSFDIGNDAVLWTNNIRNSFSVSNGEIVAADFGSLTSSSSTQDCLTFNTTSFCTSGSNQNEFYLDGVGSSTVVKSSGFNNISFSPSSATPVPFGVSTDLSILVLGGLYGASRLRKKLASK